MTGSPLIEEAAAPRSWRSRLDADRLCDALALVLIAAALVVGARTTWGLTLPYDPDHFRDLAFAQTALDGHPLADASYRGEWIWYNPLVPWLVALIAWITGTTPAIAHVGGGPLLNLLGPIAFYVLAARMSGRPAALAALTLSLFFVCTENCWACATYSPWFFASTFTEGLFYAAALALVVASTRRSLSAALGAGALVGLTFLSHTAPALLLGLLALLQLRPRQMVPFALAGGFVALPFIVSIWGHYHLRVVNPAPLRWEYGPLLLHAIPATLRANAVWLGLGALGLVWQHSRLVVAWLAGSAALLAWSLTPAAVVPTFHAWIYLMAATVMLGGVAVARVLRSGHLVAIACGVAVVVHWPAYAQRQDFTLVRGVATSWSPDFPAMSTALRSISQPSDVVLGTYGAANLIIGPAGRKVVAPHPTMANPYVPVTARVADRDAMLKAVQDHDRAAFTPLKDRYRVSLVMSVGKAECEAAQTFEALESIQRFGDVCLARVK